MNDDFSEILGKFTDILKEKNIDLNNLAGVEINSPADNSEFNLDIDTILKIKDLISKINKNQSCPRNKLLHALEPYLKEEKKEKLNQYIKIANLLSVIDDLDLNFNFRK